MRTTISLFLLLLSTTVLSQSRLRWSDFERLEFEEVFDEESATWLQAPKWSDALRNWDGKEVTITGYVIALDPLSKEYALSAFPFASCFFCGAAGPESGMELKLETSKEFLTDDVRTFIGTLKLNEGPYSFPLTLTNAILKE